MIAPEVYLTCDHKFYRHRSYRDAYYYTFLSDPLAAFSTFQVTSNLLCTLCFVELRQSPECEQIKEVPFSILYKLQVTAICVSTTRHILV